MSAAPQVKTCTKCGEVKPLDAFGKRGKRNGVQRYEPSCKLCRAAAQREWVAKNPGYQSEWRRANAERTRAYDKARRSAAPEREAERNRTRYWADPERERNRVRRWAAENPDLAAAKNAKYRALKRNNDHTPYSRSEIFAAYAGTCAYCDAPAEHIDHVVPISRGGADAAHNLLPACAPCNLSKSDKSLAQWAATFGAPSANGVSA